MVQRRAQTVFAQGWQIARRVKEAWGWWACVSGLGLVLFSLASVMTGLLEGQPISLILMYVTVALAFIVVLIAEGAPLLAALRIDPEKVALREEIVRLQCARESEALERLGGAVDPDRLTSRATIQLSGPTYEIARSENVGSLVDAGGGELQINWATSYRDNGYQLFITPKGCHLVRHSKAPSSVGMAFVRLDDIAPDDPIEVDVLAIGERA